MRLRPSCIPCQSFILVFLPFFRPSKRHLATKVARWRHMAALTTYSQGKLPLWFSQCLYILLMTRHRKRTSHWNHMPFLPCYRGPALSHIIFCACSRNRKRLGKAGYQIQRLVHHVIRHTVLLISCHTDRKSYKIQPIQLKVFIYLVQKWRKILYEIGCFKQYQIYSRTVKYLNNHYQCITFFHICRLNIFLIKKTYF